MRLTWATDVHLEFPGKEGRAAFANSIALQKPDKVLLTGDIANAECLPDILEELHGRVGVDVLYVLGNHDFYHGSIYEVRQWADERRQSHGGEVCWMHGAVDMINDHACIVGVDGMADAQLGDPRRSNVGLNDWMLIQEMDRVGCAHSVDIRIQYLKQLGEQEAKALREPLAQALAQFDRVFLMTHVPPWKEATWHEGRHSDDNWLPWFSCKAVGDCIEQESARHPGKKITVLCGHTHGYGHSNITDDIEVYTGMATYYMPEVQLNFDVMEDGSYEKSTPINEWEAENS